MSELKIDGITPKQLHAAQESLITLYELKEEYARAKANLVSIERRMAQHYDTVNFVLSHITEPPAVTITVDPFTHGGKAEEEGADDGE